MLLRELFGLVTIPPAVARETPRIHKPAWILERGLVLPVLDVVNAVEMGPGERETIAPAIEMNAARVILDERRATRLARRLDFFSVGTVGVLLLAKSQGLLPAVGPAIDALLETGFHLGRDTIADALARAGEEK